MDEKEVKDELSLDDKDKILTEIDRILDRDIWYTLDPFYKEKGLDRLFKLEDFYFSNYLEQHREKIVRIFLQLCSAYDCLIEDESLYPDKIDPRMEDYDYVDIEDMEIDHFAFLIRNIMPCGEYCCTRFYFWEIDSVIEINSLKTIYIFTESRAFLGLIEKLATAEGLYLNEEHFNGEDYDKLNELIDKLVREKDENSLDSPPKNESGKTY